MTRKQLFFAATSVAAITILIVLATRIDLAAMLAQIGRVGIFGAMLILLALALAMLGPLLAWHILMQLEGVPVRLGTTLISGLMGFSVNLISPLMYFGGEGVRTYHIASVTGIPRPRVLATIAAGEFQALTALTASIIAALIVAIGGSQSGAIPISWMVTGALSLAIVVGLIFCLLIFDVHLAARILGFLARCGIYPAQLESLRGSGTAPGLSRIRRGGSDGAGNPGLERPRCAVGGR